MRFLFLLGLIACGAEARTPAPSPAPTCPVLPAPTVISIAEPKYDERHEHFDLPDTPELWAPAPEDEAASRYRAALAPRVDDLSPRALLKRQRAVLEKGIRPIEAFNEGPISESGRFVTPSCLERRLFARELERFPQQIEHPTELGAFLVRGHGRVHVYFSTMDMVGQKIRKEVTDRVKDDVQHGYRLVAHLHSHPFTLDGKVGDRMWTRADIIDNICGALAPSFADAGLWVDGAQELSLEEGWITNGLDSVHVPKSVFPRLKTRGD